MRKEAIETKARTRDLPIAPIAVSKVVLPLKQEYGERCVAMVSVGQEVRAGDLVASSNHDLQIRIHAPMSGRVTAHDPAIVIEGKASSNPEAAAFIEARGSICELVKEAGVVGLGGAAFPTYAKLSLNPGERVEHVLINACESEPYLTGDHRVLLEQGKEVVSGLKLMQEALGAENGAIVTGSINKNAAKQALDGNRLMVVDYEGVLGYERSLIQATLGREVPIGKVPKDVGVVVQNVQTAVAVFHAVHFGEPLISRVITVSGGAIGRPGNYRVPIGSPVSEILQACQWDPKSTDALILGGPMMGNLVEDLQTPIRKGVCGLLALTPSETKQLEEAPCIRCGWCADVCPLGLMPAVIAEKRAPASQTIRNLNLHVCVECGECEYICPSGKRLVQKIRMAKKL